MFDVRGSSEQDGLQGLRTVTPSHFLWEIAHTLGAQKERPVADAKEVGVENATEETFCHRTMPPSRVKPSAATHLLPNMRRPLAIIRSILAKEFTLFCRQQNPGGGGAND
jgi:hypothetical protein